MKYLTRILVDKKTAIHRRLNDSYAWHKAVWEAFPNREDQARDFLIRVDNKGRFYQVLVLSCERPTLPGWGKWETKEVGPRFLEYDRYRFELRVNPTVKRVVRNDSGERKKNGQRTAIYDREALENWLRRKALASGFDVERFDVDPPLSQPFRRKRKAGKHIRVDFRGILRVVNQSGFKSAFAKGIGPAKAFGFGMLVLQPLK